MWNWCIYAGYLAYLEIVYHLGCFGLRPFWPVFALCFVSLVGALEALVSGRAGARWRKRFFWIFNLSAYLLFFAQTVYYKIFRQPLQMRAIVEGGEDALTNYWREALTGVLHTLPLLALMALPLIAALVLMLRGTWKLHRLASVQQIRIAAAAGVSAAACAAVILVGRFAGTEYYEDYSEFFDPLTVAERMGLLTMVHRDGTYELQKLAGSISLASSDREEVPIEQTAEGNSLPDVEPIVMEDTQPESAQARESSQEQPAQETPAPELPDFSPNVMELDLEKLAELSAGDSQKEWLARYISELAPTNRNEYTGMFEGYNLIFLTAEGFSTYAIRPELTPTLYKLVNSGFVFNNYYVPLWNTSTSDGEYINCTGLIPDGQFSMKKSKENDMAYTLPRFFAREGVYSLAYHDNSLSYYDRYLTHPNLGYDFKAAKLGKLEEEEWGDKIFYMEHPDAWPASDYEMMLGTVPEYVNMNRFLVYYMTVSGHMNYDFSGNRMSYKNREAVADLDMSENARAYIACHIELDKALENLIDQLEAAGKLENTVICLSADHYPYAMTEEQYEELAGRDLSQDKDLFRNSLILWNAGMEEPVVVDKVCGSMDLIPTLLNLFGFEYDSRFYAGRDIFSDAEGMVIFNDRSFVTDTVKYDRKAKTETWNLELTPEEQENYMDARRQEVKDRYDFSAYILEEDYYRILRQCVPPVEEVPLEKPPKVVIPAAPEETGEAGAEASGEQSPEADGEQSPGADEDESIEADGEQSPEADGEQSPEADGAESTEAVGEQNPEVSGE